LTKGFKTSRELLRCETGSAAVEFAFIGIVLVALTVGVVEFGRGFYTYNKLSYAADLGERIILTVPESKKDALMSEINTHFSKSDQAFVVVDLTSGKEVIVDSASGGECIVYYKTLVITFPFQLSIPGLTSQNINLKVERRIPLPS
jgi:Flp pilus assembly protein TadG